MVHNLREFLHASSHRSDEISLNNYDTMRNLTELGAPCPVSRLSVSGRSTLTENCAVSQISNIGRDNVYWKFGQGERSHGRYSFEKVMNISLDEQKLYASLFRIRIIEADPVGKLRWVCRVSKPKTRGINKILWFWMKSRWDCVP